MNLKNLLSKDFRHTALNQIWKLFSSPLLLILLPIYLTPEAQGYWYTFISMAALAVFADMGFSAVLLLFSAHEFAHLSFNDRKILIGQEANLIRMATLFMFAARWSATMAFITFPIVLLIGFYILDSKQSTADWKLPWLIYGASSILVFFNSMLLSFIEGCDSVSDAQKIRFQTSIATFASTFILLILGAGLYALAISLLAGAITSSLLIFKKYKNMIFQLYKKGLVEHHPWRQETLPLIWRFAISWISGYFIFSIFTPIAFHYYGAIEAGKVGLSMAVCTAVFGISNIWITAITPKMNIHVAQNNYLALNSEFKRSLCMATLTYFLGILAFIFAFKALKNHVPLIDRLVSIDAFLMISLGWLAQLIINSLAIYMRTHKKEPLVIVSVTNGIYVCISTILAAAYLPFEYFFIGFISAYLIVLPWVCKIFTQHYKKA